MTLRELCNIAYADMRSRRTPEQIQELDVFLTEGEDELKRRRQQDALHKLGVAARMPTRR